MNRLYGILRLSLVGLLVIFVLDLTPTVRSQTSPRLLVWSSSPFGSNNEQAAPGLHIRRQITEVEIIEFLAEGREINIGEGFSAPDDWLRTISFKVKNNSNRVISTIQISLIVPDNRPTSPQIIYCYGCAESERNKGIAPGEVVELRMPGGNFYNWVKDKLQEKGVLVVHKAEISHMYIILPEGPTFQSGCIKTANLRNACL